MPKSPLATARAASAPKRRASSRSNVVGLPPRCRCPSVMQRVSFPVRSVIHPATRFPMPPRRSTVPTPAAAFTAISPEMGAAPSATTTMEYSFPRDSRSRILSHALSMSKGISGIKMTSASLAKPEFNAIHPA